MKPHTFMSWAAAFALAMFSAKAEAAARVATFGPLSTGGARFVTKKRRRHGRTYRA